MKLGPLTLAVCFVSATSLLGCERPPRPAEEPSVPSAELAYPPPLPELADTEPPADTADTADPCNDPSKVPFTGEIVRQHNLSLDEIKKLVFYSSQSFTVSREAVGKGHEVTGHKLITRSGKTYDEVSVECLVAGSAKDMGGGHIMISFDPSWAGVFEYAPEDDDGRGSYTIVRVGGRSNVKFEGEIYKLEGDSVLLFEQENLEEMVNNRRKAKGNPPK